MRASRVTGLLLAALLAAALLAPAVAFAFSYVIDEAGVLPAESVTRIDAIGSALEKATPGAQVAVLTVKSLGGRSIEEVAVERFRAIGIGAKDKNNGVLILVAPAERRVRIEVGPGLQGRIPDAKAGAVIDEVILPAFRAGNLPGGIVAGYEAIAREVAAEYNVKVPGLGAAPAQGATASQNGSGIDWCFILGLTFFVVIGIWIAFRYSRFRNGSGGTGGSGGPWMGGGGWTSGGDSGGGFGGGDSGGSWGGGGADGGGASGGW